MVAEHSGLGRYTLDAEAPEGGPAAELLFTENETNVDAAVRRHPTRSPT